MQTQVSIEQVLGDALRNLVRNRELLGYRLAHAHGWFPAETLAEIEAEYGVTNARPADAVERAILLTRVIPSLNAELVEVFFNLTPAEAQAVFAATTEEIRGRAALAKAESKV